MYTAVNTPASFARQQPVSGHAFTATAKAFTTGTLTTRADGLEGAPHERRLAAGDGH
jgi:hypothetical protein